MSNWTHGICVGCFSMINPGRQPVRMRKPECEQCCFCGTPTHDGIYVRAEPTGLRHCAGHDD